jgi:hypothetical protein
MTGGSPPGHRKMREVGSAAVSRARGRRGKRGEPKAGEGCGTNQTDDSGGHSRGYPTESAGP